MNENIYYVFIRVLQFCFPFILSFIGIIVLYFIVDEGIFEKLFFLMLIYMVPPLGKESLIPIGMSGGTLSLPYLDGQLVIPEIDPFVIAVSIAFVDIMVALFLVWNYDLVKKIPVVGDIMERIEHAGKDSTSRYAWIKPLEFIGIILFVIIPFQGSGGFFASVVGRLFGMRPWNVFVAIVIGSLLSTFLVAYFTDVIFSFFVGNVLLGLLVIILVLIFIYMAMYWIGHH